MTGLAHVQCTRGRAGCARDGQRRFQRSLGICGAVILGAFCLLAAMPMTVSNSSPDATIVSAAFDSSERFELTFRETGLLSGTAWTIALDGQQEGAAAPAGITFDVPRGTYAYSIGAVGGAIIRTVPEPVNVTTGAETVPVLFAPAIQHVVVIVYENAEVSQLWEYPGAASYLLELAAKYGNATNFYAACHPSIKDYVAMTSGRSFNCYPTPKTGNRNIANTLAAAGYTWAGYFESLPAGAGCGKTSETPYESDHNPFLKYSDLTRRGCAGEIFNGSAFTEAVDTNTLPTFAFYVPNCWDDGHTIAGNPCTETHGSTAALIDQAADWTHTFLGTDLLDSANSVVRSVVNTTAFFLVYDEGDTDDGYASGGIVASACPHDLSVCGGHILMTVVSPYSIGRRYTANATDFNLESTVDWLFGLPSDGGNDSASLTGAFPPMTGLFSFTQNQY